MEKVISTYELKPIYDSRKSFYGKALVRVYNNGVMELISYTTTVSRFENGVVKELGRYSQTTSRHQKEFRKQLEG